MRKLRAVIFDDDASIRNLLTKFLVLRGYECLSFDDPAAYCAVGRRGEDRCAASRVCSDILITDITMPGISGLDLLERQQQLGCPLDTRNKAVISGAAHERNLERLRRLGCTFFKKPFAFDALADWLAGCEQRLDRNLPLATRPAAEQRDVPG